VGLYVEILAAESERLYERRGRVQRIVGISPQWLHHPDAIRVWEPVFAVFSNAFRATRPRFNYYGPTEYRGQEIVDLCGALRSKNWADRESNDQTRIEAQAGIEQILAVAERALANGQSLLVLGI